MSNKYRIKRLSVYVVGIKGLNEITQHMFLEMYMSFSFPLSVEYYKGVAYSLYLSFHR